MKNRTLPDASVAPISEVGFGLCSEELSQMNLGVAPSEPPKFKETREQRPTPPARRANSSPVCYAEEEE